MPTGAKNLKELLMQENHNGFRLRVGYYAKIDHGLMGLHPVIEEKTAEMVITTDLQLLKEICSALPPRQFKVVNCLLYVDGLTGQGFVVRGTTLDELETANLFPTMTRQRYRRLKQNQKEPFMWAPGVVGAGVSGEWYSQLLEQQFKSPA